MKDSHLPSKHGSRSDGQPALYTDAAGYGRSGGLRSEPDADGQPVPHVPGEIDSPAVPAIPVPTAFRLRGQGLPGLLPADSKLAAG
jgi:hypothetical protein